MMLTERSLHAPWETVKAKSYMSQVNGCKVPAAMVVVFLKLCLDYLSSISGVPSPAGEATMPPKGDSMFLWTGLAACRGDGCGEARGDDFDFVRLAHISAARAQSVSAPEVILIPPICWRGVCDGVCRGVRLTGGGRGVAPSQGTPSPTGGPRGVGWYDGVPPMCGGAFALGVAM